MPKSYRNKKTFQILKRAVAWTIAFLFMVNMSLNLQAMTQGEDGNSVVGWESVDVQGDTVQGEVMSAFGEVEGLSTGVPHWAAQDQVVPVGQNYVDFFFELMWGDVESFPINASMLTLSFHPTAFILESSRLMEGVPGTLVPAPPMYIPANPPYPARAAQSFQISGLGGPLGIGYEGRVAFYARLNIAEGFLANPGDVEVISLMRAAMPGFPANFTEVTVTRASPPTFDVIYQGNPQHGGTVEGLPANQRGFTTGESVSLGIATPTHTPVVRDGTLTNVSFYGWSLTPVARIITVTEGGTTPTTINSVTISDRDVTVFAVWMWGSCVDCDLCLGCNDCFDCEGLDPCPCESGYCVECCDRCDEPITFTIVYRENAQGGTVEGMPTNQTGLATGVHNLTEANPTHTSMLRDGVPTHVVFLGWSLTQTNQIFAPGATAPELLTRVTITNANVHLYALWGWGSCVECSECPGCDDCFDCEGLEPCDCDSGYCTHCCEECDGCDCTFICDDCGNCCDLEPCDCGSGYCTDCCEECDGCDCTFICDDCGDCCDLEPCDCGSGYCTDCCQECEESVTFTVYFRGNPQGGTVSGLPANLTGLVAGNHGLGTGVPTHTPVLREGVLTHVVFRGWSPVAITGIFAPGATLPTLLTSVEITNANVNVYALWGWGTCVECTQCPGCEDCVHCDGLELCDCESGYCADCCTECDQGPIQGPQGEQGTPGVPGTPGAPGTPGTPGADGRPVPKTGDTANMNLWMMVFVLGLLGLGGTSMKLVARRSHEKIPLIVIENDDYDDFFIMKK